MTSLPAHDSSCLLACNIESGTVINSSFSNARGSVGRLSSILIDRDQRIKGSNLHCVLLTACVLVSRLGIGEPLS